MKQKKKQYDDLYDKASSLTTNELKEQLRLNSQKVSGTKSEILERVIDGQLYGALPRCTDCGGGILRVKYPKKFGHKGQGKFHCPGYFDDVDFVACKFTANTINREPWKTS